MSTADEGWPGASSAAARQAQLLRERFLQNEHIQHLVSNRTHVFFVAGWAFMHPLGLFYARFLWGTAGFRHPLVVQAVALAVCGAIGLVWLTWLAPRWFRPVPRPLQVVEPSVFVISDDQEDETPPAAAEDPPLESQCTVPARGSADMNLTTAVTLLTVLMAVLVSAALRTTRGMVAHGQVFWLGLLLPIALLVDGIRHAWAAGRVSKPRIFTLRFPATAEDAAGQELEPTREGPWVAGGNVALADWRVCGSLAGLEAAVVASCITFERGSAPDWGAIAGWSAGLAALLGVTVPLARRIEMRVSNLLVLVGLYGAVLLALPAVVFDRHRAHDTGGVEHAGLVSLYLLGAGLVAYAYAAMGLQVLRRVGTVHCFVVATVSLALARLLSEAFMGTTEHLSWLGVLGAPMLVVFSCAYLYSCVVAQMRDWRELPAT